MYDNTWSYVLLLWSNEWPIKIVEFVFFHVSFFSWELVSNLFWLDCFVSVFRAFAQTIKHYAKGFNLCHDCIWGQVSVR